MSFEGDEGSPAMVEIMRALCRAVREEIVMRNEYTAEMATARSIAGSGWLEETSGGSERQESLAAGGHEHSSPPFN